MTARIVPGTANRPLAGGVGAALGTEVVPCEVTRFPDGELRPIVGDVRGEDVYVVQPTGPAVNEHLVELLLLLDACRRGGAGRVTAVVPYFGYARQDRRGQAGEAVGGRVMADVLATAGAQRLIVVDPHTAALEAMCGVPAEMLTAVPVLAEALTAMAIPDEAILVAPDLGAVKLAEHYAALLHRPVAVVRKTRLTGTAVQADEIIGTVEGRPAVIVDDMISTGGTIEAAIRVLLAHGATPDIVVAATHGLLVADAADRLGCLPIRRLIVTDTVMPIPAPDLSVQVRPVATLLAEAIGRAHQNKPLDDLMMRT
ncbi:ribose-phosphate pyrophosphokinase [Actinoallomurus oryzae]|uniref:ribose-phosphate diphosphokinase n=1 Tax=Actinoallomurus oryzae TaxID=502180 RepID=A0ABP8QR23_9ACTN